MGAVGGPVIRRIVQVGLGPERPADLLASVGLSAGVEPSRWASEFVSDDAYYGLVERVAGPDDHAMPFRYARSLRIDDFGALGLALKTAPTVHDSLLRLVRYILVLSDTLEYAVVPEGHGARFELQGRPHHRRGARLANECALAAVIALLREAVAPTFTPQAVSFSHGRPPADGPHREFFGAPVEFDASQDALHLTSAQLSRRPRLADGGLSAFLLAQLDALRERAAERSTSARVRGAIADALPDGQPSKSQVARRLGLSERTLHRRLAEEGQTFQALATDVRREAAASLLSRGDHTLVEVAFLTGFADQTAFSRAFKRWTGRTPAAFREAAGA